MSTITFSTHRMRDCGEEVLVDISEILFNELAFFKLMQDLDDPDMKDKLASSKWRTSGGHGADTAEADKEDGEQTETDTEMSTDTGMFALLLDLDES